MKFKDQDLIFDIKYEFFDTNYLMCSNNFAAHCICIVMLSIYDMHTTLCKNSMNIQKYRNFSFKTVEFSCTILPFKINVFNQTYKIS